MHARDAFNKLSQWCVSHHDTVMLRLEARATDMIPSEVFVRGVDLISQEKIIQRDYWYYEWCHWTILPCKSVENSSKTLQKGSFLFCSHRRNILSHGLLYAKVQQLIHVICLFVRIGLFTLSCDFIGLNYVHMSIQVHDIVENQRWYAGFGAVITYQFPLRTIIIIYSFHLITSQRVGLTIHKYKIQELQFTVIIKKRTKNINKRRFTIDTILYYIMPIV